MVESPEAKFLTFVTPSGLEPFLDEVSQPAKTSTLPPPPLGPPDMERFDAAAANEILEQNPRVAEECLVLELASLHSSEQPTYVI